MKFNLLTLEATKLAVMPRNSLIFRHIVYHVKELFMLFLPLIELNNSKKIELSFGPRGDEEIFNGDFGVTNVFIENFNFENFYKMDMEKQEKEILKIIVSSLCEISQRKGEDITIINALNETECRVIESKFNAKIHIKKLSKTSPDKACRVDVFRCINARYGESWSCELEKKNGDQVITKWMTKVPSYLDKRDFFKKSFITNDEYIVYNQFSDIVFKMALI